MLMKEAVDETTKAIHQLKRLEGIKNKTKENKTTFVLKVNSFFFFIFTFELCRQSNGQSE